MKKVLITGFDKFGKYAENPTANLCEKMDGKVIGEYQVLAQILDTKILNEGPTNGSILVDKIIEHDIDLMLSFGISSDVRGLRIESKGVNIIDNLVYALPHEQGKEIIPGGQEEISIDLSKLPVQELIQVLQNNDLLVEDNISTHAGRFCCNALIYDVLHFMTVKNVNIPFMFFHCSCTLNSIKDILEFDSNKTLITDIQLEDYLKIILSKL